VISKPDNPILGFPKILGVYSSETEAAAGAGTTIQTTSQKIYWFVRQLSESLFETQPLNSNHVPSGLTEEIDLEAFSALIPEPGYYKNITQPTLESLKKKILRGEKYFEKGQLDAAERQFLEVLKIDELNPGANFGLGMVYSEKKEYAKIKKVLNVLLDLDGTFKEEYRERFNSLGISLRKNGMIEDAIRYYERALEYNEEDDHLHFNMARTFFEKGDIVNCKKHLSRCLEINPGLEAAQKFMRYLKKKHEQSK
jgi:tetratricopeptide (TPR) repeat protein